MTDYSGHSEPELERELEALLEEMDKRDMPRVSTSEDTLFLEALMWVAGGAGIVILILGILG